MSKSLPKKTPSADTDALDFEQALAELEALVSRMEGGELSLEDALAQFERGIALTRRCQDALKTAELRVKKLVDKPGGEPELEPFQDD